MADVRILPDILSNKIAAGEVVERPVSVVKELVENALDAGATRIVAEIEKGGRDLIQISDNGCGMSRDNALLAIERYATSKIFTDEDLFSIKTFGFRGEALPSMASVSKFTLTTREKDSDIGTRIKINGGRVVDVQDAGAPVGTMVEVGQLYFNTPARRKFLKGINTEMGHIADVFSGMALGNPRVGFRLIHNSRLVKAFSSKASMETRTGEVFGLAALSNLKKIELVEGDIAITGYLSDTLADPSFTRSTAKNLRLFVNNRLVNDRGLVAAIFQGYKGRLMKGRYPLGLLFVNLPHDQVDVNVHPSKLEVRFSDQKRIFSLVVRAVIQAFLNPAGKNTLFSSLSSSDNKPETPSIDRSLFQWGKTSQEPVASPVLSCEPEHEYRHESGHEPEPAAEQGLFFSKTSPPSNISPYDDSLSEQNTQLPLPDALLQVAESLPGKKQQKSGFDPVVIGQVMGTYIVVEYDGAMVLVDQHAAHERIVYERLKKRSESYHPPSQFLAVPETLELTYQEADLLESILPDLAAMGMEIEPFGGTAFIVKAIPGIIDSRDVRPLVLDIVEKLLESGNGAIDDAKKQWLDQCLTLMACHTAIRANQKLNPGEMEKLITELDGCDNPDHCPHGRPTRIRWDVRDIERLFKRIV